MYDFGQNASVSRRVVEISVGYIMISVNSELPEQRLLQPVYYLRMQMVVFQN